jgi:hypothetical protein
LEGLDEVVLLVGTAGGVAFVRGLGDQPGPAAGDDIEEDDGQHREVGLAGGVRDACTCRVRTLCGRWSVSINWNEERETTNQG